MVSINRGIPFLVSEILRVSINSMSFDIYLAIAGPGIPTFALRRLVGLSATAAPDSAMLWPLEDCELDLSKGDDGRVFQP